MPIVDVLNVNKEKVSEISMNDAVFNIPVREDILHEVVTMQLANRRAGTASTKSRSEVRGGGKKPWRQKGTGRARSGSNTSPLFKRGGVVFGPKPRDYSYRVPRKVRKLALKMAISSKFQNGGLVVIEKIELDEAKTKKIVQIMNNLGLNDTLIVTQGVQKMLERSVRNVPSIGILPHTAINVYDILLYKNLLLQKDCIPQIEEALLS